MPYVPLGSPSAHAYHGGGRASQCTIRRDYVKSFSGVNLVAAYQADRDGSDVNHRPRKSEGSKL